jgi:hypothetical protein
MVSLRDRSRSVTLAASLLAVGLSSCASPRQPVQPVSVEIQQNWQLQPGQTVSGFRILGGVGDISVELNNDSVYAPFDGTIQPNGEFCVMFSSPEVPAYLLRFCGLNQPKLGDVREGQPIGRASTVQIAALRRLPDGKWTMVEPSNRVLERALARS